MRFNLVKLCVLSLAGCASAVTLVRNEVYTECCSGNKDLSYYTCSTGSCSYKKRDSQCVTFTCNSLICKGIIRC